MPVATLSPARQLLSAIDELMSFAASCYFQHGQLLRRLNKEERKYLYDLEGRVVGLVAVVADGRIPFAPNCPDPSRYTPATGLRYSISNVGLVLLRDSSWEAKMLYLRAAVQAVVDTEQTSGQKDKNADVLRKKRTRRVKNLRTLLDLERVIVRGQKQGQTMTESAVEFTHGDEKKAQALLRSLRRNRDRLAPS